MASSRCSARPPSLVLRCGSALSSVAAGRSQAALRAGPWTVPRRCRCEYVCPTAASPIRRTGSRVLAQPSPIHPRAEGECNGRQDATEAERKEASDEVHQGEAPGHAAEEGAEAGSRYLVAV